MSDAVMAARPLVEVAEVIRSHGEAFLQKHGGNLSATQKKALRDLGQCRTASLGGHVERCLDCGARRIAYNSCRNRHCPKCQALSRARWLERESAYLLPVEYHHVVFTLPAELADLALAAPSSLYNLLMSSAAATLREVAANPKRLGAQVGVLMVLHTWGQNLHHHPHVHCVVTGGGLSCNRHGEVDASPRWVSCRPGFFLPVRVLSRVFRGKFLAGLRGLATAGTLPLPELAPLYAKNWVVYAKPPFGGPEQVLKYLARYTHRVAISNHRLTKFADNQVTFRYHDYADARKEKMLTLSAEEFLRRFMQHVLPKGFMKIRHSGLLASRLREARLHEARKLLLAKMAGTAVAGTYLKPAESPRCLACGGVRLVRGELLPRTPLCPFPCAAPGVRTRTPVADTS
jgi:hypothetical protein